MRKLLTSVTICPVLIVGATRTQAASVTIYDGSISGTPDSQGWLEFGTAPASFLVPFGPIVIDVPLPQATQTVIFDGTQLNTRIANEIITDPNNTAGGYSNYQFCIEDFPGSCTPNLINPSFPTLDRNAGYTIRLDLQINNENHTDNDQAGFSLIAISNDLRGIQLGFWEDEIWARHDDVTGTLLTRAEGMAIATTLLRSYELTILGNSYTLSADNSSILAGPLRDYSTFNHLTAITVDLPPELMLPSEFSLPYDPYETPNLLAFGDNIHLAGVNANINFVSVTANDIRLHADPIPFEFSPALGIVLLGVAATIYQMKNKKK